MSAFRQLTLDQMVLEAGRLAKTEDLTSSQITLESDPGIIFSIRRTVVVDDGCPEPPIGNAGERSARHTVVQGLAVDVPCCHARVAGFNDSRVVTRDMPASMMILGMRCPFWTLWRSLAQAGAR